jgi:hypothetical protein
VEIISTPIVIVVVVLEVKIISTPVVVVVVVVLEVEIISTPVVVVVVVVVVLEVEIISTPVVIVGGVSRELSCSESVLWTTNCPLVFGLLRPRGSGHFRWSLSYSGHFTF